IRNRILSVTSHATMTGLEGDLPNWRTLQRQAQRQPGVVATAPYIEEQSMLANGARIDGASVRGIIPDQEEKADGLAQRVTEGKFSELQAGSYNMILGTALAKDLSVRVGGSVVLIAPDGVATPTGVVPRMRRFQVVGLLESGMYEIDRNLALVHMTD